jgi:triosephosphate isomerase
MNGSSTRRPLVVGNWKMHKTVHEARTFVHELVRHPGPESVEVVVAPPFTALFAVREEVAGSRIAIGAQTMHENDHGAHTGDISATMLVDLGVTYVILGHSERREHCGETDLGVNRKVRAALQHGITPIVAVGETAGEHEAGAAIDRVTSQTRLAFEGVAEADVARCVVAYEPIWAIGTGKSDKPEGANTVMGAIRGSVRGLQNARILYGGSMKPDNAPALLAEPNIDGGLIGGASLSPSTFTRIIEAAATRVLV